jgi:hypothetical protein
MDFEKELQYYLDNKEELLSKYEGKVLIIKDESIEGVFDSVPEAYNFGIEKYGLGNFAIQQVTRGVESHTAVFHSPGIVSI